MEKKVIVGLYIFMFIGHFNLSFSQLSSGPINGITQEFGKDVNTEILEEYGSPIGTITYLRRASRKVKAKFFAYNPNVRTSAYTRFLDWKKNKNVILLTSAGFSQSLDYPICKGLCVEEGEIIGSSVDNDLDGLVFIYGYGADAGGVVLVDLDKDYGKMTLNSTEYRPRLTPSSFVNACGSAGAFAFQTQLFYFTDKERFSWTKSQPEKRSRRYFAVVKKNGEVSHVVFHIPREVALTDYAVKAYNLLKSKNYEVIGLLNFDTGWYDYFRLYYDSSDEYYGSLTGNDGQKISLIGNRDYEIEKATNFIVYYYE